MLKMTRKAQQGVVIYPKRETKEPMTIRVTEIILGTVGLGFEGLDYEVVRSEIYSTTEGNEIHDKRHTTN